MIISALLLVAQAPAEAAPTAVVTVDEAPASAPMETSPTPAVETSPTPAVETSPTPAVETSPTPAPVDPAATASVGETVSIVEAGDGTTTTTTTTTAAVAPKPARHVVMDPLPSPPPPVPRDRIRKGPWRGRWWAGLRIGLAGPLGGDVPAKPTVGSVSGGFDLGYRVNNWLGIGTGFTGHLHDRAEVEEVTQVGVETRTVYGDMIFWDPLFARLYLPVKRRFQPFAEVGGGLASYERAEGGYLLGGQVRGGVGFDGWVTSNITLGLIANYRLTRLNQKFADGAVAHPIGHSYQVLFELGFHW
ncbi:MAG: hypothetical protein R3A79_18915 [Nannocystaceae bacterium]